MKIKEVMTRSPEIVRASDTIKQAAEKMKKLNVGVVPVFNGNDALGMLTDRDITVRAVAEGLDPSSTKVGDIMTSNVISCSEDADIGEAAKMMREHQIRRLLVKDGGGKTIGVISLGDLAMSLNRELTGEVIREVSKPAEPER